MRAPVVLAVLVLAGACAGRETDDSLARGPSASAKPMAEPTAPPASSSASAPSSSRAAKPAAATTADDGPRVWAKSRFVWVHPEPNDAGWIGYLWLGGSAKLREPEPKPGTGCTKWYAIEPRGFVCLDGERATLDPNDPALAAIRPHAPNVASPWPHRYAESRGAVRYAKLPEPREQRAREWDLPEHLQRLERARAGGKRHPSLLGVELEQARDPAVELGLLPATVHEPRGRLTPLSTVAYSKDVLAHGRSWLLSADLMWVPKDRVAPYSQVTFQGVHLGGEVKLPLAFFRSKPRSKWRREAEGRLVETSERWERLGWVGLTGKSVEQDGETYLETRDGDRWVKKSDAVLPSPQEKTPWGAPVGAVDTPAGPAGRRTWMQASVWKGWLIAYEGTQPVFTTLIAPGRGGTPQKGIDPIETASTPVGVFPITGKFATATMVAPGELVHSDVPWTQNFHGAHALHGAYWHDDWGERKSGGCVNVSPIDGKWLFEWTEPPIPEGWHGVRWRPTVEPATTFIVHD